MRNNLFLYCQPIAGARRGPRARYAPSVDRGARRRVPSAALKSPRPDESPLSAARVPVARRVRDGAPLRRTAGSMAVRVGFSATISRKPRQARKGAAVAVQSGAGGVLARAATPCETSA